MHKIEVEIKNKMGLHARPASLFVKEASKYRSNIKIEKSGKEYIAKSIMGILSMSAVKGDRLTIAADGPDEILAIERLKELVDSNFGE